MQKHFLDRKIYVFCAENALFTAFSAQNMESKNKNEKNVKKLLTYRNFGARISLASAMRTRRKQTTTYGEISKWS